MLKRIFCALLVLVMLTGLVACGPSEDKQPEDSQNGSGDTVPADTGAADTTADTTLDDNQLQLPEMNWNDRDFTMLCRTERLSQFGTGEVAFGSTQLEKAIYERNETVQSQYGVNIIYEDVPSWSTGTAGEEMMVKLDASAQAGCPDYDVVAPDYYWGIETRGYFTNLLELDYLNFNSPWWWMPWNECYTLDGKLTTAVGWLTLDIVQGMEVVYFNTDMMPEVTDEDVYQLVYNKEWTFEKMKQLSADATYNVASGDAWKTQNDYVHGTILHYMGNRSLFFALGGTFVSYEEDGSVLYNFATDKNQQVADLLSDWILGSNEVFYADGSDFGHKLSSNENPAVTAEMFAGGHSLFYCYGIKTAELLASLNVEFGVLPPPLLDQDQEDYITTTFGTSVFAIERGRTEEQKQFASFVLEALNHYSYTIVREVYYEKTLKLQYGGTDKETKDMIDTVVESAYIDFAYVSGAGNLMGNMLNCIVNDTSLTSKWIEIESNANAKLAEYLEGYLK